MKSAKNEACLKFYFDKYDISGQSHKQKILDLGKELKLEEQRRKRKIPLYKEAMYKRLNEVRQKEKKNVIKCCNGRSYFK